MVNKGGAAPDASWLLSLYSQMSRGVVFQDGSGAILSANPAAENILGLSLEQMAGRSSLDPRWNAVRRTGEPFEGSRHPAMVALATGRPVYDEIMEVRKPGCGDYTWIQINAFPLKEGSGIVGVFTTFEDVTERLRAEDEVRASELRYRSLFENMLLGAAVHELVYDEEGEAVDYVFLDANQAFGTLTGLDPAAIVGKRVTEVIPDIEPGYIANYGEVARTGKSIVFESEAAALGRRYLISAFKTGERRFATIFDDITERAAAAAALGRAAEERRALFRELEHRVKNSLALIAGLITLEEDRAPDASSRKALQETRDRITSLAALYEQLHAGGDSLDVAAGEYLRRVVEGIASSYAPEGKGIIVGAEVEPIVLPASAAASLGIVVNELVTNALKHGFPGGRRGRVDVRLARRGDAAELRVEDDGVGLPEGFSLEKAEGLGTRIVWLLAEQLGGRAEAGGGPGGSGAAFRVAFPLKAGKRSP